MFLDTLATLSSGVLDFFVNGFDFFISPGFLQTIIDVLQKYLPLTTGVLATVIEWILENFSPFLLQLSLAEILLYTGVPLILVINYLKWVIGIIM